MDNLFDVVWLAALVLLMQSLIILVAVALGGWLVFRTRRDSHERLFFDKKRDEGVQSYLDPVEASETMPGPNNAVDMAEVMQRRFTERASAAYANGGDING